jgi:uncharacterized NAD(P)/FAD-binding protein YdhS
MKCEAAEIETSLTVYDHTFRRSGAPCRANFAEGSSNTRAPGGTFTATEWRRRSKQRSQQESGQLRILAGHIVEVNAKREGASVSIRPRASEARVHLEVSRIVSCRGMNSDARRSSNPLVAQLLAEGYDRADPLGIGLDVDSDCTAIDASGGAFQDRVFAIGPMSQAAFWEVIAVPDICLQAASLARRLTRLSAKATGSAHSRSPSTWSTRWRQL